MRGWSLCSAHLPSTAVQLPLARVQVTLHGAASLLQEAELLQPSPVPSTALPAAHSR